jgi:hypothetical protein
MRKDNGYIESRVNVRKDLKKIGTYYSIFFVGSLLPFLIVEWYFQDYRTIGLIALLACAVLTVCFSLEYLRITVIRWGEIRNKNIHVFSWAHKKEEAKRPLPPYYFRNFL